MTDTLYDLITARAKRREVADWAWHATNVEDWCGQAPNPYSRSCQHPSNSFAVMRDEHNAMAHTIAAFEAVVLAAEEALLHDATYEYMHSDDALAWDEHQTILNGRVVAALDHLRDVIGGTHDPRP